MICIETYIFPISACGRDGTKFDIVFYIDHSTYMSSGFDHQIEFFQTLAAKIYVGINDSHIAAVNTGNYMFPNGINFFNLTTYNYSSDIASVLGLQALSYGSSGSHFASGLPLVFETLQNEQRMDAEPIIIAVTADTMIYSSSVSTYMDAARANGTKVITLSVGSAQAGDAVTDPDYHFHAANASQLLDFIPSVVNILCPCK